MGQKSASAHKVKSGSVVIDILPVKTHGWRFHWYDEGKRRYVSSKNLEKLKRRAKEIARKLDRGNQTFDTLPTETRRILHQLAKDCPTEDELREFLDWRRTRVENRKTVSEAIKLFLAAKKSVAREERPRHLETLRSQMRKFGAHFGERWIDEITPVQLNEFLAGFDNPKTRYNNRGGIVNLFNWCRKHEILPNRTTAAERTESPKVSKKVPETWTPVELQIMLENVRPEYLGWLCCSAFLGMRVSEILRLDWSIFKWEFSIVEVPPGFSKNEHRRIIPICDSLKAWLPCAPTNGPICKNKPNERTRGNEAETARLGALVGGWRQNALRHSYASYRCAIVGAVQTASEMDNSEGEIRRTYRDAKTLAEAEAWFGVVPSGAAQPIGFARRNQSTPDDGRCLDLGT